MSDLKTTDLEQAFKEVHTDSCDAAWVLHEDDVSKVLEVMTARKAKTFADVLKAVSDYFRIDNKSKRIMTQGFLIWGGVAYFIEEADAVAYLNDNGFACTTFHEAYEASEAGQMDECYFTEWYEAGYCSAI